MTVVFQGHQVPQAPQALQDTKASQGVMEKTARKDPWDSRGRRGHLDFLGHLERRVCWDLQGDRGPLALRVPEVNLGHLQMWIPAPESRGFLGYQAQEAQKERWGPLE